MVFQWQIFPVQGQDLPGLFAVESACFSTPWSPKSLAAFLHRENTFLAVAKADEEVVGFAGMDWVVDEGYVANVAVLPAWRGRGLGRALVAALLAKSRAKNLAFLSLEVRESNLAAIALYEQSGFILAGRRKNFYETPREDGLILTNWQKGEDHHADFGH